MSRPVAQGALWEHLHREWADRLIVVMTANDLRRTEVQISRELSWERTAQDLAWELVHNPRVNALSDCAWVICSFDTSGAFLLHQRRGTLFFDPQGIEGTWSSGFPGGMIGYNSCLAASIVRQLLISPENPDIRQGIQSGIQAQRRLHQEGYGDRTRKKAEPRIAFPLAVVAAACAENSKPCSVVDVQDPVAAPEKHGAHAGSRGPLPVSGPYCMTAMRIPWRKPPGASCWKARRPCCATCRWGNSVTC